MIYPQYSYTSPQYYPQIPQQLQNMYTPQQQPVQQQIRSGMRRRDSLGRYADGYSHDEAKDRLMNEMQGMMGDVSPEAQHAIQKAINALGNE